MISSRIAMSRKNATITPYPWTPCPAGELTAFWNLRCRRRKCWVLSSDLHSPKQNSPLLKQTDGQVGMQAGRQAGRHTHEGVPPSGMGRILRYWTSG